MNAAGKVKRFHMILSMSNPLQREAWNLIHALPAGERTNTVCQAVCGFSEAEKMLEAVRKVVREELGNFRFEPVETVKSSGEQASTGGEQCLEEGPVDFLSSLNCLG